MRCNVVIEHWNLVLVFNFLLRTDSISFYAVVQLLSTHFSVHSLISFTHKNKIFFAHSKTSQVESSESFLARIKCAFCKVLTKKIL